MTCVVSLLIIIAGLQFLIFAETAPREKPHPPQQWNFPHQHLLHKQSKCDGKKNLIDDLGIVSFIISIFSTFIGFGLDLVLSLTSNKIALLSKFFSLLFGVPSSLITALNISNPFTYILSNGLNLLSLATVFFGFFSFDIGNLGLLTDVLFELLGIIGLVLSIFSTFPESFDLLQDFSDTWGFGDEVKEFIDNYGCRNPYIS